MAILPLIHQQDLVEFMLKVGSLPKHLIERWGLMDFLGGLSFISIANSNFLEGYVHMNPDIQIRSPKPV